MAADTAIDLLFDGIREFSLGEEQSALAIFARALEGRGSLGALCSARLSIIRREYEKAARELEGLVEREPGLAEAHYLLGTVYRHRFQVFDAVRSFREALRLDPAHGGAASGLSDLLEVQEP